MANQKSIKWRTILGLVMIYVAMWFNMDWLWGVLFLYWVIPDLFSGTTYFMEPVNKKEDPILYWIIIVSWILMSLLSFLVFFYPEWQTY